MKKIVTILFFAFLCINTTYALETCTPSDEYLKYQSLSDEEKKEYIEPAYCKELMIEKESDNFFVSFYKNITNTISASSTDTYYNAANDGLITTPQNQGGIGTCWAFSSISAVESNARKNNIGSYNFSESHMLYSVLSAGYSDTNGKTGKYNTVNFDGGKVTYAVSYYFNNYGQLLDNEWPYSDSMGKINSSQYKKGNKLISVGGFNLANIGSYAACSSEELTYIKKQVINYGSVQASMYMDENLFKDSGKNYYISSLSNSSLPNHGISIVGWDDTISKNNFNASRNGAFIIKNSWGPTWSSDGYFYISYDDSFICKNTASFYDVSNVTYKNTYASADMVGVPTFMFDGTFYTSAKFTKSSTDTEELKRVSFPIGDKTKYSVYLVADNVLTNNSNWELLTTGTSTTYGIKSVDVSDIMLSADFTIVVKYEASAATSVFTMCNNIEDTSQMTISTNTNYYASTLSNWADMSNIPVQGGGIACEPNIFAYTDDVTTTPPTPTEQSIVINSIIASGNNFIVSFTNNNVSTSSITYAITNSSNTNVTSRFTIVPNYSTNKITIKSDGTISGRFNFIIKYNGKEARTTFNLTESITPKDSSFIQISGNDLFINIDYNYTLTYEKLLNALTIRNTGVQVLNASGNIVTSNTAVLGTNSKVKLNNNTYTIVILGDVNCDGKITAMDYIDVRKHIMGTTITDTGRMKASDLDKNSKINAMDYIAIRKILMR